MPSPAGMERTVSKVLFFCTVWYFELIIRPSTGMFREISGNIYPWVCGLSIHEHPSPARSGYH
jgi:hypothetical protein